MGWVAAGEGYEISLVDGKVTARSASGRVLKALPRALRDHPEVERLRRLAEWLDRHAAECVAKADTWMVSSLPVPTRLIVRVWPDEAWQKALRDLVLVGDDPDEPGFLRDVTESGELRVVNLDGETVKMAPTAVTFPHPVLLPDLDELRRFAAELGIIQQVEQIYRATWVKPPAEELPPGAVSVGEFAGAAYPSRFRIAARAESLGYRVSGGYAACRVREGVRTVEATVWIGEPYWDGGVETGDLTWQDERNRRVPLRDVGAVAWSEGMRMAAALHAGRTVTGE